MTTATEAPPGAPVTPTTPTSIRLAALYRTAITEREKRLAPAIDALRNAESDDEMAAASGELIAAVQVADDEYDRRVNRAVTHLAETPAP